MSEALSGVVEVITYRNDESGFTVAKVAPDLAKKRCTVVGEAADLAVGHHIECEGDWIYNARFGEQQFKADRIKVSLPTSSHGLRKFLSSGAIPNVGPAFAEKLIRAFGERLPEVIEKHPSELQRIEGVGEKRRRALVDGWRKNRAIREVMEFLFTHGLGPNRAAAVYKAFGADAVKELEANPYLLSNIEGIGFESADKFARSMGIVTEAPARLRAGISYTLEKLAVEGHCAVPLHVLAEKAKQLLGSGGENVALEGAIDAAISIACERSEVMREVIDNEVYHYLPIYHRAEVGAANQIARLSHASMDVRIEKLDVAIDWVEKRVGMTYSPSQREALKCAIANKVVCLIGGAGVGKTAILNGLIKVLEAKGLRGALCAPTGRAAKRMEESTGREAMTIQRLLKYRPGKGFTHGRDEPLEVDFVAVDEMSMVDVVLAHALLRAIPHHARLIIIGDKHQIAAVGPGQVLSDVIGSARVPVAELTEIHRQAEGSGIIANAHRINDGEMPEWSEDDVTSDFCVLPCENDDELLGRIDALVAQERRQYGHVDGLQILAAINRGPTGVQALNARVRELVNPSPPRTVRSYGEQLGIGDRVVQLRNNYDLDVFNGDQGRIERISDDGTSMLIRFAGRAVDYPVADAGELALGYATTIHKAQGSQFARVAIPLVRGHFIIMERNLLYTAVTRATEQVILLGDVSALGLFINTVRSSRRMTLLDRRIENAVRDK